MFFRLFLAVLLLAAAAPGASIDRKISKSKQKLTETKRAYKNMDKKLASIARKISLNRQKLRELDSTIATLEKEIESSSLRYEEGQKRLAEIRKQIDMLKKRRSQQEKRLIDLMANRYILGEIKRDRGVESPEDVVENEVLKALARSDSRRLKQMQTEYEKTLAQSRKLLTEAESIKRMIKRLEERKAKAAAEKVRRRKLESKLKKEKREYQARLERLQKEESNLRKTLARLNILKRERVAKSKERKISESTKRAIASGDKIKVRTIGSSYQKHAVGRYRGKKTISPVGRAKVVKRFGSYIDPVYKIRIFNESVTLRPYKKNAKVKNVLNGRVVFVKDTKMLGKVVIIEHKNNLHTIYAKMSKIAPTIKEGKKVKKGYVIGRVDKELMFEVTQRERHINPLELITVTR
ncbi:MAG: peptidoglycan DD-metalloendopeptidase family protein [Hydrogenimonas sp.]|nr:peptidoglycan DD-metalloendopeptidase family protein [Hydrogenimonas sp.]